MSEDEQAVYDVSCPKCKAKKWEDCIYLPVQTTRFSYTPRQQAVRDRVGTPTKRPHNERRSKAVRKIEVARRQAYYDTMITPPAALVSLRAFDMEQYDKTKAWLRRHGHILWEMKSRGRAFTIDERFAFERAWDARVASHAGT